MDIDVVIGNPPYQEDTVGKERKGRNAAKALYHKFIIQADLLRQQMVFIIPSRWFTGGLSLGSFKDTQLNSGHVRELVLYEKQTDVFPTVDIQGGIVILRKDNRTQETKNYNINYTVVKHTGEVEKSKRKINRFDIFVRDSKLEEIIEHAQSEMSLSSIVGFVGEYGISTSYRENHTTDQYYNVITSKGIYTIDRDNCYTIIQQYRPYIQTIVYEHAGQPNKEGKHRVIQGFGIMDTSTICSESYIKIGEFAARETAENALKYLKTKFVRSLIYPCIVGIHINKEKFRFVPMQNFTDQQDIDWNTQIQEIDKQLYKKYKLQQDSIDYIENMFVDLI